MSRKDGQGAFSRLMGYVGRSRWPLACVFLAALLGNTALLLAPKLVGRAIDLIRPEDGGFYPALLRELAVIAVLYLAGSRNRAG